MASNREIKNTFMNLANENVSLLLACLKGHSSVPELWCILSQLTLCQPGRILQSLLTSVGNDGKMQDPKLS